MKPLDWLQTRLRQLDAADGRPELPDLPARFALACFDAESDAPELEQLLRLWQQLWQGEPISLILALNGPEWGPGLIETQLDKLWPQPGPEPDLILLEDQSGAALDGILAQCELYLTAARADSAALLQAALAGCAILAPDGWFHHFLAGQPGVWLYDPQTGPDAALSDLLAGRHDRQLPLPPPTAEMAPLPVFEWLPALREAEACFRGGDALRARSLCLDLLEKHCADSPAVLLNPGLRPPEHLISAQLLQLRLQRYVQASPETASAAGPQSEPNSRSRG